MSTPPMLLCVIVGVLVTAMLSVAASSTCSGTSDKSVIPHPTKCAQYFNCSGSASRWWWEDHLQECPYLQLFDVKKERCQHFSLVKCGNREEAFDLCDYRVNSCERSSHCMPCRGFAPSCKGLPDGLNPHSSRPASPYYVLCQAQRVVKEDYCTQEYKTRLFDPVKKMCL